MSIYITHIVRGSGRFKNQETPWRTPLGPISPRAHPLPFPLSYITRSSHPTKRGIVDADAMRSHYLTELWEVTRTHRQITPTRTRGRRGHLVICLLHFPRGVRGYPGWRSVSQLDVCTAATKPPVFGILRSSFTGASRAFSLLSIRECFRERPRFTSPLAIFRARVS